MWAVYTGRAHRRLARGHVPVLFSRLHLNSRYSLRLGSSLVIANSYHRYWSARIDGKNATVLPADHSFQGAEVPAGEHDFNWNTRLRTLRCIADESTLLRDGADNQVTRANDRELR
jgi:hypothetical protein